MKPRFFEKAKQLATNSDHHQHKIGAVLVKKNSIVSTGYNQLRTHPKSPHPYKSCHAEFCALIKVVDREDLRDCTLYVYRQNRMGVPALARPCSSCLQFLKNVNIKEVYYTINNGWAYEFLST